MVPRARKLVGSILILAFMAVYIWAASMIAARLPAEPLVQLAYFLIAGTAWGVPLFPLIAWVQREPRN